MIYFCSSLPRSGTNSICRMASICGLKPMHVLNNSKRLIEHIEDGYNFFADTPFYNPNFIVSFLESYKNSDSVKIIHVDRNMEEWHNSFTGLWAGWSSKPNIRHDSNSIINFLDKLNYEYLLQYEDTKERYKIHRHSIKEIAKLYNIEILYYSFSDGWKPFCDFTNKPIPAHEMPFIKNPKPIK